jgi:hypothetical protein
MSTVDEILDMISGIDTQKLRYEIKNLRAIRDWALQRTGVDFIEGDRVVIAEDLGIKPDSGWWQYRETLAKGQTGIVKEIGFNEWHSYWYAGFFPDQEWSISSFHGERRHWHGPRDATPEGYDPPSDYEAKNYPEGRKHTFSINVVRLRKVLGDASS